MTPRNIPAKLPFSTIYDPYEICGALGPSDHSLPQESDMSRIFATGEGISIDEGREVLHTIEEETWELDGKKEMEQTGYICLRVRSKGDA